MSEFDVNAPVEYRSIEGASSYMVGPDGTLWRNRFGKRRQLFGSPSKSGHIQVSLTCDDGTKRYTYLHRLVLETLVGPCPVGKECLHIDGNPGNNRLDNLRWGTRQENVNDTVKHERHQQGERHSHAKITNEVVMEARRMALAGVPIAEIAKVLDVNKGTIGSAVTGKSWKHLAGAVKIGVDIPARKTGCRGEGHHASLLTIADVTLARDLARDGRKPADIARTLGKPYLSVIQCIRGKSWAHVPGAVPSSQKARK